MSILVINQFRKLIDHHFNDFSLYQSTAQSCCNYVFSVMNNSPVIWWQARSIGSNDNWFIFIHHSNEYRPIDINVIIDKKQIVCITIQEIVDQICPCAVEPRTVADHLQHSLVSKRDSLNPFGQ